MLLFLVNLACSTLSQPTPDKGITFGFAESSVEDFCTKDILYWYTEGEEQFIYKRIGKEEKHYKVTEDKNLLVRDVKGDYQHYGFYIETDRMYKDNSIIGWDPSKGDRDVFLLSGIELLWVYDPHHTVDPDKAVSVTFDLTQCRHPDAKRFK